MIAETRLVARRETHIAWQIFPLKTENTRSFLFIASLMSGYIVHTLSEDEKLLVEKGETQRNQKVLLHPDIEYL